MRVDICRLSNGVVKVNAFYSTSKTYTFDNHDEIERSYVIRKYSEEKEKKERNIGVRTCVRFDANSYFFFLVYYKFGFVIYSIRNFIDRSS